jgi:hypothetical protein
MRTDIPICALTDRIADVHSRVEAAGWDLCVVVNDERIILGLLHGDAWSAPSDSIAEDVMSSGPPTTRPSTFLDDMVERLQKRNTPGILISSSNGVLMGYLWTTDAETAMSTGNCTHTWTDRNCPPSEI